jgi:hypothetical protein
MAIMVWMIKLLPPDMPEKLFILAYVESVLVFNPAFPGQFLKAAVGCRVSSPHTFAPGNIGIQIMHLPTGLMPNELALGQGAYTLLLLGRISRFVLEISSYQHVLDLIRGRFRC